MKSKTESYTFRIPTELRKELEEMAEKQNRSFANLIITLLWKAVEE